MDESSAFVDFTKKIIKITKKIYISNLFQVGFCFHDSDFAPKGFFKCA